MVQVDIDLDWAGDFTPSAQGDLLASTGLKLLKDRLIRRFFTNPGEVITEPSFGAGLGRFIDAKLTQDRYAEIRRTIIAQVYQEDYVARSPEPEIEFTVQNDGLGITIRVWTKDKRELTFEVTP